MEWREYIFFNFHDIHNVQRFEIVILVVLRGEEKLSGSVVAEQGWKSWNEPRLHASDNTFY